MKIINSATNKEYSLREILEMMRDGKLFLDLKHGALNLVVKYIYRKLVGSITVMYVDENGEEIADRVVMDNLPLGTYEVEPKAIENYELIKEEE